MKPALLCRSPGQQDPRLRARRLMSAGKQERAAQSAPRSDAHLVKAPRNVKLERTARSPQTGEYMGRLVQGIWGYEWYDTSRSGGRFERQSSQFRNWVTPDGSPGPTGR